MLEFRAQVFLPMWTPEHHFKKQKGAVKQRLIAFY